MNEHYYCAMGSFAVRGCVQFGISNNSPDDELKATLLLRIAKIHYGHTRKFSVARDYARQALKIKPSWGDPLILIGKLYASSGPLCGPGTGFQSQIVCWPAIDKWNEAKRIDSNVAAEANKLIRQYAKATIIKNPKFRYRLGDELLPCLGFI